MGPTSSHQFSVAVTGPQYAAQGVGYGMCGREKGILGDVDNENTEGVGRGAVPFSHEESTEALKLEARSSLAQPRDVCFCLDWDRPGIHWIHRGDLSDQAWRACVSSSSQPC